MTRPGNEPSSSGPLANVRPTCPMSWSAEKCKPCENFGKTFDVYEEAAFSKTNTYKRAKYGFAMTSLSRKDCPWNGKKSDSSVKNRFQVKESVKKVMLTVFWDINDTLLLISMKKLPL